MTKFQYGNDTDISQDKEINLKEYFEVIKSRFWIVLVLAILTTLVGTSTVNTQTYRFMRLLQELS